MSPLPTRPAILAVLALAGQAPAHPALIGGFRPIAAEEGARALWVNPAAVGLTGMGTAVAELFLDEPAAALPEGGGEWTFPSDVSGFGAAAATDRMAYGYQRELEDRPGVPSWTFALANRVSMGRHANVGAALEWRGGEDGGLEGQLGALLPAGRHLRLGVVLHELFERGADGADGSRHWQVGGALRLTPLLARVTWDAELPETGDPVHWFGFAVDRSKAAHLSLARSSEGDWSASLDLAFPNHLVGVGALDRDASETKPDRAFLAAEWRGQALPGAGATPRR
jgi:hypothetical protein